MIVIDASALAKYLLREENWEAVEDYLLKKVYSLDLAVKEVANAIWKHVVVRKVITADMGLNIYRQLRRLVHENIVVLESQDRYIDKAVELALEHNITVYDSLYIAQALKYGELLTGDEKQASISEKLGINTHYIK